MSYDPNEYRRAADESNYSPLQQKGIVSSKLNSISDAANERVYTPQAVT